MPAALGWVLLGWQPRGGRIGGRAARDRVPHALLGGFTIEGAPAPAPRLAPTAAAAPARTAGRPVGRTPRRSPAAPRPSARRRPAPAAPEAPVRPVSGVQQLLALAQQGGVR
jgi:hypothetical protein